MAQKKNLKASKPKSRVGSALRSSSKFSSPWVIVLILGVVVLLGVLYVRLTRAASEYTWYPDKMNILQGQQTTKNNRATVFDTQRVGVTVQSDVVGTQNYCVDGKVQNYGARVRLSANRHTNTRATTIPMADTRVGGGDFHVCGSVNSTTFESQNSRQEILVQVDGDVTQPPQNPMVYVYTVTRDTVPQVSPSQSVNKR